MKNHYGVIKGFSTYTPKEKQAFFTHHFKNPESISVEINNYLHPDKKTQLIFNEISENTITNFYLPYTIVPNFKINGKMYTIPMVIEESSVIAAAANSAKFWAFNGGFHYRVVSSLKTGQVHFFWEGSFKRLETAIPELKRMLRTESSHLTERMEKRGGGITNIQLINAEYIAKNYYQLHIEFNTADAMGANFINSCLEQFALSLKNFFGTHTTFYKKEKTCEIIMSILSNYTPGCIVECYVECPVEKLTKLSASMSTKKFLWRFQQAITIAKQDIYRAVTHNKGIFNGIDAVAIATGNDWRAIESNGHAFAARSGKYSSLTDMTLTEKAFRYTLTLPLAIGTIGGLTSLHPLAKRSLELLNNPNAEQLMGIMASAGLANNFGAIRYLITTGIQHGHMKLHLSNILNKLGASESESEKAIVYFKNSTISHEKIYSFLKGIRQKKTFHANE